MHPGIGPPSVFVHEDGARTGYEILGSAHLNHEDPIILIGGISSLRGDWDRLAKSLAQERPVLIYDHRGIGDSSFSREGGEDMTIELLARDLLELVCYLKWEQIAICGFSMGGMVAQQLLFLPYHPFKPTALPFRVTHVLLTGTLCTPLRGVRLKILAQPPPPPKGRHRTHAERREIARPGLESTFDPAWVGNPDNAPRLEWWLDRMASGGRPMSTIMMQARAGGRIQFEGFHEKLPRDISFLVIHGELDEVVPFSCSQEILQKISWAKMVEVGPKAGQIPDLAFGHTWYEYFDVKVWHDVIQKFLGDDQGRPLARL
ncbi:Alpha/Beta hydrolase protein [Crucibulum laeve]|uniref:Alpha/Beta hydrolase protein n=1 Tax=Crucibulum laeve TaxID=68775 RepID=A0A5C3MES8_9AGAR|nr:Alpha/Beta hydrolase protein [Crucibulum laeve]